MGLSEVGFDVYDWLRNAALCFLFPCSSFLGPKFPFKTFFLICILHHATVLALAVPMAIKYADMPHHWLFPVVLCGSLLPFWAVQIHRRRPKQAGALHVQSHCDLSVCDELAHPCLHLAASVLPHVEKLPHCERH